MYAVAAGTDKCRHIHSSTDFSSLYLLVPLSCVSVVSGISSLAAVRIVQRTDDGKIIHEERVPFKRPPPDAADPSLSGQFKDEELESVISDDETGSCDPVANS